VHRLRCADFDYADWQAVIQDQFRLQVFGDLSAAQQLQQCVESEQVDDADLRALLVGVIADNDGDSWVYDVFEGYGIEPTADLLDEAVGLAVEVVRDECS